MALRTIRLEDDEILRKRSKPVRVMTERTQQLIDDMIETVHDACGAGLAAVQVGVLKRICIVTVEPPEEEFDEEGNPFPIDPLIHNNGEDLVIINPEITINSDEEQCGTEGCLSFPGKFGYVTRPNDITLRAFNRSLEPYEIRARGLFARAIMHECDHMEGVLYVDKVEDGEVYDLSEMEAQQEETNEETAE